MASATMTAPAPAARLSTTQKAASLYSLGYRARLAGGTLIVSSPTGHEYRVDPTRDTCSCPASVRCSHLLGWFDLCIAQANATCWRACELSEAAQAETEWEGRAYTARGLELRAESVRVMDRSSRLAMWAYEQMENSR